MIRRNRKGLRGAAVLLVSLCSLVQVGCTDAVFDALGAGALDFLQGSLAGVASFVAFGENPPSLIFNSLLNTIGGGSSGAGH